MKIFNFIKGAAIGSLVGAAVAILFAPASGDDLRSRVQDEAQRIRSEINLAAEERGQEMRQQLDALRNPGQ